MIKILNIVGARPQIIKASAISRCIINNYSKQIEDIIVHTGQHYDENMSSIFFNELKIPQPKYNLNIGSATHGIQTAGILKGIEEIMLIEKPDFVLVYGDTNSTIAAALAAAKLHFPVIHIEAGLRSFNKSMPEEINRIVCDHVSTLLFSPTQQGYQNLINEGFKKNLPPYTIDNPGVFHVGDIMLDNSLYFAQIAEMQSTLLNDLKVKPEEYILTTIHRDHNTDNSELLESIIESLIEIVSISNQKVVLPLHPRTLKVLSKTINPKLYKVFSEEKRIIQLPPVSFLDMILLEKNSHIIITDSGGVQKEAHFFHKPCIILRSETEWVELVKNGTAILTDSVKINILKAFHDFNIKKKFKFPNFYGDGKAAEFICRMIVKV